MKTILLILALMFAVIGICELLHTVRLWWLLPFVRRKNCMIVFLGGSEDPVRQMMCAGEEMNWRGTIYRIAVYGELSERQDQECRKLAKYYDMIFCPIKSVGNVLENINSI